MVCLLLGWGNSVTAPSTMEAPGCPAMSAKRRSCDSGHVSVTLGELIHAAVRDVIEVAVELELAPALGAGRYERRRHRQG